MTTTKKPNPFVSIIKYTLWLLISLSLCAISVFLVTETQRFLENGITTNGKVVSFKESRSSSSSKKLYAPIVIFTDKDGKTIRFTSKRSSSPKNYEVGEIVEVLYMARNSKDARIKSFFGLWLPALISGFFGLISAFVFIQAIIKSFRN